MPTGSKDEHPSIDVIRTARKVAQIATNEDGRKDLAAIRTQVPDPERPRPSPPPPRPKNPEWDDPEQDDPQEPEQEKPPPLPPWLNQASTCILLEWHLLRDNLRIATRRPRRGDDSISGAPAGRIGSNARR